MRAISSGRGSLSSSWIAVANSRRPIATTYLMMLRTTETTGVASFIRTETLTSSLIS